MTYSERITALENMVIELYDMVNNNGSQVISIMESNIESTNMIADIYTRLGETTKIITEIIKMK